MERSVSRDTTRFVLMTIGLVLVTASVILFVLSTHARSHSLEKLNTDFKTYDYAIENHVRFYQQLIDRMSERLEVQEMLEFDKTDEAFLWAQKYRKLLPGAIGFALINTEGEVLGRPEELFIGPGCRTDIHRLAHGEKISFPKVHREIEGFEHFDLMQPVTDINNELVGFLFISFSLNVLADFSNELVRDGHHLALYDENEQTIIVTDYLPDGDTDTLQLSAQLPMGNWSMSLEAVPEGMVKEFSVLGISAVLLAVTIGFAAIRLSRRVSKGLVEEVESIHSSLNDIADGDGSVVSIRARYRETKPVMDAVNEISYRIQQQKTALLRLSETDELTGLMNRRRFAAELEKVWTLAQRGTDVLIMSIDLDGFKQINDRFGHAAGDKILKEFSCCLKGSTRESDLTARLGGDEFVVILLHSSSDSGEDLFNRLNDCFQKSLASVYPGYGMACSLSAGLIRLDPDIDTQVDAAMQRVDAALYRAKQAGKNRVYVDEAGERMRNYQY